MSSVSDTLKSIENSLKSTNNAALAGVNLADDYLTALSEQTPDAWGQVAIDINTIANAFMNSPLAASFNVAGSAKLTEDSITTWKPLGTEPN